VEGAGLGVGEAVVAEGVVGWGWVVAFASRPGLAGCVFSVGMAGCVGGVFIAFFLQPRGEFLDDV